MYFKYSSIALTLLLLISSGCVSEQPKESVQAPTIDLGDYWDYVVKASNSPEEHVRFEVATIGSEKFLVNIKSTQATQSPLNLEATYDKELNIVKVETKLQMLGIGIGRAVSYEPSEKLFEFPLYDGKQYTAQFHVKGPAFAILGFQIYPPGSNPKISAKVSKEAVTTPVKTFTDAYRIDIEGTIDSKKVKIIRWYSPEARNVVKEIRSFDGKEYVIELEGWGKKRAEIPSIEAPPAATQVPTAKETEAPVVEASVTTTTPPVIPEPKLLWSYEVSEGIYNLKTSSDGSYIVVASMPPNSGGIIYLLNKEGKLLWSWSYNSRYLSAISISSDGSYIVTETADNIFFFTKEGKLLWSYKTGDIVYDVSVSSDGSYIAAGSGSNVYFFNREGKLLWSYETGERVNTVSISSDGSYIVAGSYDFSIYFFNRKGTLLWNYKSNGGIISTDVSLDGSYTLATSGDGNIYFFNKEGIPLWKYQTNGLTGAVMSFDGSFIVTSVATGDPREFGPHFFNKEGKLLWSYKTKRPTAISISRDGSYIGIGTYNGSLYLFNTEGKMLWNYNVSIASSTDFVIPVISDGPNIVAGASDGKVYFFKAK